MNKRFYMLKKINKKYLKYFFLSLSLFCIMSKYALKIDNRRKRVGIIGFMPDTNIGNNLLKYSMYMFLKNNGFFPILISVKTKVNIYFLRKKLKIKEIRNYYTDLNENDFDILIVNSDQCWSYEFRNILEIGFLSFAKDWNIPKFVYAASLGHKSWNVSKKVINSAKILVNQFSGISVREYSSIEIIKRNLGIEPYLVLDPTLLLNKFDYLKILDNYNSDIDINENYLVVYILDNSNLIQEYIEKISKKLNYRILYISSNCKNYIEKFIFSFNISKAIITDSFHGTILSIIFNKPFMTFINSRRGLARFTSLNQTFQLYNRFIFPRKYKMNDLDILKTIPNFNKTRFNFLKMQSLNYIKKRLGIN